MRSFARDLWSSEDTACLHEMNPAIGESQMLQITKPPCAVWVGRTASALVVAALLVDGAVQLFAPTKVASMMQETGFEMDLPPTLGGIMVACAVVYAIPASTVLGAILVAGFLGGAICAHVRLGEVGSPPEIISLLLGLMAWGGLYLRDPRVRAILPLNR